MYQEIFGQLSSGLEMFLNFYLKNVGDKFLFHCNFDYRKLPVAVSEFYKECIQI